MSLYAHNHIKYFCNSLSGQDFFLLLNIHSMYSMSASPTTQYVYYVYVYVCVISRRLISIIMIIAWKFKIYTKASERDEQKMINKKANKIKKWQEAAESSYVLQSIT